MPFEKGNILHSPKVLVWSPLKVRVRVRVSKSLLQNKKGNKSDKTKLKYTNLN